MSVVTPMGPMELPMVIELKRPASFRADVTVQGTAAVQAYDGKTAWGISPQGTGQAEPMPAEAAKEMADQADLDGALVDYKAKGHQVELVGGLGGGGRGEQGSRDESPKGLAQHGFMPPW